MQHQRSEEKRRVKIEEVARRRVEHLEKQGQRGDYNKEVQYVARRAEMLDRKKGRI